jgi:hypothetical protein
VEIRDRQVPRKPRLVPACRRQGWELHIYPEAKSFFKLIPLELDEIQERIEEVRGYRGKGK